MKNHFRHRFILGLLLFTALFSIVPSRAFAVAGTIYFTPNGGPVISGNTFTVEVRGNVPRPFWSGGATVGVTYPTNLLQATAASSSGGAMGGNNPTISNGTVNFTVFNFWGVAVEDEMIFRITFRAIGTGNATLNFTANTNINDGPTTKTPSTFAIQAATCPAGQVGTPPNCTTPAPSPSPSPSPSVTPKPSATPKPSLTPKPSVTPSPSPTPTPTVEDLPTPVIESDGGLKIENVKIITNRQKNSVTWTMNKANATPTVTYGLSKEKMTSEAEVETDESGGYSVEFESLKPGTLYYFTVKAVSPDNLQGASYSGTLTTRGYPVQLTIQQNGVLAPGAKVTIGQRSFYANKNAIITTELGEGNFTASIMPAGSSDAYPVSFTVAKKQIPANGNPELQSFVLNAVINGASTGPDDSTAYYIIGGVVAALLSIGALVGFLFYKRKRAEQGDESSLNEALLIENYGNAIESYRANTPIPNLDTSGNLASTAPVPQDTQYAGAAPIPETPVEQMATAEQTTDPMVGQNFDPSSLPLPPVDPSMTDAPASQSAQPADGYSEAEQIAPELAQIEAGGGSSGSASDEPSAIYDASTGELDIIHHASSAGTPENAAPTEQLPPVQPSPYDGSSDLTPSASTINQPTVSAP